MVLTRGIEPLYAAYETAVLPLYDASRKDEQKAKNEALPSGASTESNGLRDLYKR